MNKTFIPSPNFDDESYRKKVDTIVIHWIGTGTVSSAIKRFQNPDSKVSAHFIVEDDNVTQMVDTGCVAWHAGNYEVNQRSIGIEHSATTTRNASEKTYETSAELIKELCAKFNIPLDREHIIAHREIVATACPGTIDIDKLISLAKEEDCNCEEEKAKLLQQLIDMRASRDKWKNLCEENEESYEKSLGDERGHIDSLQKTLSETNQNLATVTANYSKTTEENKKLIKDNEELRIANDKQFNEISELYVELDEKQAEVENVERALEDRLNLVPRSKLFWALFGKR